MIARRKNARAAAVSGVVDVYENVPLVQSFSNTLYVITPNVFLTSPEKSTLVLQVYKSVGEFTTDRS